MSLFDLLLYKLLNLPYTNYGQLFPLLNVIFSSTSSLITSDINFTKKNAFTIFHIFIQWMVTQKRQLYDDIS